MMYLCNYICLYNIVYSQLLVASFCFFFYHENPLSENSHDFAACAEHVAVEAKSLELCRDLNYVGDA
ncbi:hypothetical protein L1987_74493 [Smallanthus sonchifolius]|uniref:Uncharacterized protein n=1 Tax=Smallanthus sonchifolius TaxID=185202 RepID=A0ACB9A372_9ASTR|nr:hypothetical protein L1987_74493 [Smallanthus sonchifolius]